MLVCLVCLVCLFVCLVCLFVSFCVSLFICFVLFACLFDCLFVQILVGQPCLSLFHPYMFVCLIVILFVCLFDGTTLPLTAASRGVCLSVRLYIIINDVLIKLTSIHHFK